MNIKKKYGIIVYICAVLGWWGIFFPEFTFTPDTYEIISELEDDETLDENLKVIWNNKEMKIIIDSKLLSIIKKYF